jgi:hypothetical protein
MRVRDNTVLHLSDEEWAMAIALTVHITYLNELDMELRGKRKLLRYMFSDVKVCEAKLSVLHKIFWEKNLSHASLAKLFSNLPLHQMIR